MKCYQRGAQFTLLSRYFTNVKLHYTQEQISVEVIMFITVSSYQVYVYACVSLCTLSAFDCKIRMKEEMCNNFPARSSVAPVQCTLARRIMINTHTHTGENTHTGTHGSRHVLLIPLRNQPQTGSVMQRGSVGSRCRRTSKAPDGTLICSGRFSI